MLRGVNKRIIEINDTGSEIFEKAFFVVKNDNDLSESTLENEANRIMLTYFNKESQPHKGYLRYTDLKKQRRKAVVITFSSVLLILSAVSFFLYYL